jgi:hypothetical protein
MVMEQRGQRTEVLYCTTNSIGKIQEQNTRYDEPDDRRLSRPVLWEAWGEVPLAYPADFHVRFCEGSRVKFPLAYSTATAAVARMQGKYKFER